MTKAELEALESEIEACNRLGDAMDAAGDESPDTPECEAYCAAAAALAARVKAIPIFRKLLDAEIIMLM